VATRAQLCRRHTHGEQPAAAQDHQVVARALDDAAFVHAGRLHVGDRLRRGAVGRSLGRQRRRGRGRGLCERHGQRRLGAAALGARPRRLAPSRQQRVELALACKGLERAPLGRGRRGGRHGLPGERQQAQRAEGANHGVGRKAHGAGLHRGCDGT
jgi:hypothetical protein